jgi:predicted Zn-dependent peptidase
LAYQAELESRIRSLTSDQVLAAVRKHVLPKNFVIVTAGDFSP